MILSLLVMYRIGKSSIHEFAWDRQTRMGGNAGLPFAAASRLI
jgi:hypothetical protein